MGSRRLVALALVAGLAGLLGCAEPVQTRAYPRLAEGIDPIQRVAIAPFEAVGALARAERDASREDGLDIPALPREQGHTAADATTLVARYFSEALEQRGLEVVTPEDVARTLANQASPPDRIVARQVAQLAHAEFGVDAVLLGKVSRFRDRTAGTGGSTSPSSVWFEISLYSAPGAEKLWAGAFNQTQKPFTENVLQTSRYPGGGTRWMSVEELARWGAEETALQVPLGHSLRPSELR
jgi:hypothetical protein